MERIAEPRGAEWTIRRGTEKKSTLVAFACATEGSVRNAAVANEPSGCHARHHCSREKGLPRSGEEEKVGELVDVRVRCATFNLAPTPPLAGSLAGRQMELASGADSACAAIATTVNQWPEYTTLGVAAEHAGADR